MTLSIDRFTQDKLFENGGQGAFDRLVHIGEENLRVEYDQEGLLDLIMLRLIQLFSRYAIR